MRACIPVYKAVFAVVAFGLGACSSDHDMTVSHDVDALRAVVRIPERINSAKWETFGTPEYKGWVPGPTDYIILIAELESSDQPPTTAHRNIRGSVAIVPEAARPWLSTDFRNMLAASKNTTLTLSAKNACEPYRTVMTMSGRPVSGFICVRPGRSLLYLDLQSNLEV